MKSLLLAFSGLASCWAFTPTPSLVAADVPTDPVRLSLDLDRTVLPAGQRERAVVKVTLEGLRPSRPDRRAPINLALVLDRSGSMTGEKIEKAREAALEAVRRLAANDLFSLVVYNNSVETLIPARPVGDGAEIEAVIRGIRSAGGTALHGGVMMGAVELRRHTDDPRYLHRLILLSDGLANVGPSSPEDLARLGGQLVQEGISVTTIGVGLDYNEDLMTRLARRSDGNTYFVESSRDLPGIFKREMGDVLSMVARRVVITLSLPEGVRPVGLVGREGVIRGQTVEITLNQLYGGQEKFVLLEVDVDASHDGTEREIAQATVTFEDPVAHRQETYTARRSVRFSKDERRVVASAVPSVLTEYARNVTAVAKDAAVGLVDAQRRGEAAQLLRERNRSLERMAQTYDNPAVKSLAAATAAEADRLEREGLDAVSRKTYRTENAQTTGQQSPVERSSGRP